TPIRDNTPEENMRFSRDYFGAMLREFNGDYNKALAAYNAGPGTVKKLVASLGENWREGLPAETINYINKITAGYSPEQAAEAVTASNEPDGFAEGVVPQMSSTDRMVMPDDPRTMVPGGAGYSKWAYEQSQRGKARAVEEAEQQQLAAELGIVPKPDDTPEGTIPEFNTDEMITPVGEVNAEDRKVAEVEVYDPLDP